MVLLLSVMMVNKSKHTSSMSLMSSRLRLNVPILWVLAISLTFAAARASFDSDNLQLWLPDPELIHKEVTQEFFIDTLEHSVDQCTLQESCELNAKMPYLSKEQKQCLTSLYKTAKKIVSSESHIDFLRIWSFKEQMRVI